MKKILLALAVFLILPINRIYASENNTNNYKYETIEKNFITKDATYDFFATGKAVAEFKGEEQYIYAWFFTLTNNTDKPIEVRETIRQNMKIILEDETTIKEVEERDFQQVTEKTEEGANTESFERSLQLKPGASIDLACMGAIPIDKEFTEIYLQLEERKNENNQLTIDSI